MSGVRSRFAHMTREAPCPFRADVMSRQGKRSVRIRDVQCMGELGHTSSSFPVDAQHSFFAGGTLAFGAHIEQGRWVAR